MSATAAKAEIGHNSAAVGEMLAKDPSLLFTDKDMLPVLLESIEGQIAAHKPDLTTEKGRKAVASLAFGIAKQKTALDAAGKALNVDLRKKIEVTDKVRREAWDALEKLQSKARAPLDTWEEAEKDRQTRITATRQLFHAAAQIPADMTLEVVSETLAGLDLVEIDPAVFGELAEAAENERKAAKLALIAAKARIQQAEADRIELERLRADKDEAERKAREAAAAEAKKKADEERIAAAAKAAAEKAVADERRKAEEAAAAVERERVAEQAKRDAETAAERRKTQEVEAAREAAAAAERKKAQDAIDEANRKAKAAQEALEAERRAEAAKVAAAEKAKAEQARLDAERQRNQEHRQKLMKAAKEAIMEHGGVKEDAARLIVLAIVAGSVPNVSLEF